MRPPRLHVALLALICHFGGGRAAGAHPISQGALDVTVSADGIVVKARVPVEEVFVAGALGANGTPGGRGSGDDPWAEHGKYFLRHFQITADGRVLTGVVSRIIEPDRNQSGFVVYELKFPLASPPAELRFSQDVLREIEYAPGNPWEATYIARIIQPGRPASEGLLMTSTRALTFTCDRPSTRTGDRRQMFLQYLRHGINHILGGYDHLLFICALVLTTITLRDLVKVVSAFTLAHSVTLTLSVLNIVRLPSHVVEPIIAASIVVVALSNVLPPAPTRGQARLAMAFFFGLFHGLGFAGGLLDAMEGMPGLAVGLAITAFSAGVEIGHQMIVLPLFFGLTLTRPAGGNETRRQRLNLAVVRGGSLLISAAGMVYLVAALRSHAALAGIG